MSDSTLQYFNRYTNTLEVEHIYKGEWLTFFYGNPLGRFMKKTLLKRRFFSEWYGWRMRQPKSKSRILPFIQEYGVNTKEFYDDLNSFESFNDFFIRRLKQSARPISQDPNTIVFPADGRHMGFEDISKIDCIFVKGQRLDIAKLLNNKELSDKYREGTLVLSRLCPTDYHRFHFPVEGKPGKSSLINGCLYSVNPIALRRNINIFSENKRSITKIRTKDFGDVLMIEVGATCVGSIAQTYKQDKLTDKGAEKGYFNFGGSSVITIFEKGKISLAKDLLEHSERSIELYAHMGDIMGLKA